MSLDRAVQPRAASRQIGMLGAVAIGLASMIGAGLFVVWAPAAALAGDLLWVAVALAALVATLNALSVARLAARHPVSGGAYAYGRAELTPTAGFVAGWMFLSGKTASAAAIALVVGEHLWPAHASLVAVTVVVGLAALNAGGIRMTAAVSAAIAGCVVLVVLVLLGARAITPSDGATVPLGDPASSWDVVQAAGLVFFAFAGYARMATLGGEVRDASRTVPRAIVVALVAALVLYGAVAVAVVAGLGGAVIGSATPTADLASNAVVRGAVIVAAIVASLGSLIGILAGMSRTALAMARDRELPGPLARVSGAGTPIVAECAVALAAIVAILVVPTASLIAFSSTCVLSYYAIAHGAALRVTTAGRAHAGAIVAALGLLGCVVLVATLAWPGLAIAAGWLAFALIVRSVRHRVQR